MEAPLRRGTLRTVAQECGGLEARPMEPPMRRVRRRELLALAALALYGSGRSFVLWPFRGAPECFRLAPEAGTLAPPSLPAVAVGGLAAHTRLVALPWGTSAAVAALALVAASRKGRRGGVSRRSCRAALLPRSLTACLAEGGAGTGTACPESVTSGDMPGLYDFAAVEQDLYRWWESMGFFKPEIADSIPAGPDGSRPYVIPMPPPNVTGRLHMGHAMFASLQDVLTRFHRMRGRRTLWLPGMDHAGIATQMLVERQLIAEGSSRQEVGRAAFLERVWAWKAEKGGAIVDQLRRIGASTDWSRQQFTLNEHMSGAVVEAFVRLHEMGVIFKGKRMVNWSPVLQTAVSDLEVEYSDQAGHLYHFKYVLAGSDGRPDEEGIHIPVATTRPETILGDSAVCVHPEDPRYQHLIGRKVMVPLQGRSIPVIADEYVDREFGTGALKITPAHDFNDFEIAQRHNLSFHTVIGFDGTMTPLVAQLGSPQYQGLDREACRKALWVDLEAADLALKVEDHPQRVPLSQRSGEVIEPMLSDQWFVNTEDMAQRALDAVESGDIDIQPERYKKIWRGWLQEKQPWCISRQLWWGHRIPVWYPVNRPDCERYFVARSEEEARSQAREALGEDVEVRQDPDVLDTWFSSGLWPFATVGWPNENAPDFKEYYPATMMETGYDILFFWVARMVMMGLALTDKVPFKEIYLHGLVRDEKGQKMSKTKGNVVDPLDSIALYGTDALRYSLLTNSFPGMDTPLSKGMLDNAKSFANKIWNVGRFIITEYEKNEAFRSGLGPSVIEMPFVEADFREMPWIERALVSKCHSLVETVSQALLENKFAPPTKALREFLVEDFAAWYLEASKTRLQGHLGGDPASARGLVSQRVLLYVLDVSLKLLHPFMPFVTEAVWQRLPHAASSPASLMISPWLDASAGALPRDPEAERWFAKMCTLVSQIRNTRSEHEIALKERVPLTFWCNDAGFQKALEDERPAVAWLARGDLEQIKVQAFNGRVAETPEGSVRTVVAEDLEVDMPVPEKTLDLGKELQRLNKQLETISSQLETTKRKITPSFLEKANPVARDKIIQKRDDLQQQQDAVVAQLEEIRQAVPEPARRDVLAGLFCAASLAAAPPARANVGEGDILPNGARQEDRIRKGLDAWRKLAVKLKELPEISDEEWQNSQGFLRRLFGLNEDMSYLAKGFNPEKQKQSEKIVTVFKKRVKEMDKPAKAKNLPLFLDMHKEVTGYLVDWCEFLVDAQDVIIDDSDMVDVTINAVR